MNRLTEKIAGKYYSKRTILDVAPIIDKLGQLEDIEEELGIELVPLFKALKDGAKFSGKDETVMGIPFTHIEYSPRLVYGCFKQKWRLQACGYERNVEDYGKTWALNREELGK